MTECVDLFSIPGVQRFNPITYHEDERGLFVKYPEPPEPCPERFYSFSHSGVIRGMHFQIPPFQQGKYIYCTEGAAIDAVVDLRKDSPTFLQRAWTRLVPGMALWLPAGLVHGFQALTPCLLHYAVTNPYSRDHDRGIHPLTCGISWEPNIGILLSERDQQHLSLDEFVRDEFRVPNF